MVTAKQEAFCQGIIDGLTQVDAYRRACDNNTSQAAAYVDASRLMDNPNIVLRVQELKQATDTAMASKRAWDRDRVTEEAETNMKLARSLEQVSAANGALNTIVDVQGLKVTKTEVSGTITHELMATISLEQLEAWQALGPGVVEGEIVE